jgi:hypothetical protein
VKVIFKKLDDIPRADRRKDPVLVEAMEHLFDGKTIRVVRPDDENSEWFLYEYIGERYDDSYFIHQTWFKEYRIDEHKDVMNLFSMEI